MNSLDDLIRDTLAARAHDVDGLGLELVTTPPAHRRATGRWVAVGSVVAVAAAILVAVVLVAPWRGTSDRNETPPAIPTPPAGMQWVSYHGITLTVPATWELNPDNFCSPPPDSVAVSAGDDSSMPMATSCPAFSVGSRQQSTTTVFLRDLGGEGTAGPRIEVGGHPAYRDESTPGAGVPAYVWPVETLIRLPDAGVAMVVRTASEEDLQRVLRNVEYTPVDHYGCAAQRSSRLNSAATLPADVLSGAVCAYDAGAVGRGPYLLGSRALKPSEIDVVRTLASSTTSGGLVPAVAETTLVYLLTGTDGTIQTVVAGTVTGPGGLPMPYS